jgi:hypothetical protein
VSEEEDSEELHDYCNQNFAEVNENDQCIAAEHLNARVASSSVLNTVATEDAHSFNRNGKK